MLRVTYKKPIVSGEHLDLNLVRNQPIVEISPPEKNLYTLIMTDPDAPNPQDPKYAPYLHWLVVNIGSTAGDAKTPYASPNPPKGSAPHRYVFEVYRQTGKMPTGTIESGPNFDKESFVRNNNLTKLNRMYFVAGRE